MMSRERLFNLRYTASYNYDSSVLVLAMKLVLSRISQRRSAASHYLYAMCKQNISILRRILPFSLSALQVMALVALFEYGHAVFPAAWDTVVQCVKCVDILGLTMSKEDVKFSTLPVSKVHLNDCHSFADQKPQSRDGCKWKSDTGRAGRFMSSKE